MTAHLTLAQRSRPLKSLVAQQSQIPLSYPYTLCQLPLHHLHWHKVPNATWKPLIYIVLVIVNKRVHYYLGSVVLRIIKLMGALVGEKIRRWNGRVHIRGHTREGTQVSTYSITWMWVCNTGTSNIYIILKPKRNIVIIPYSWCVLQVCNGYARAS